VQIIALRALRLFWQRHPQAEMPLRAWYAIVAKASWSGPADAKQQFGSTVDFIADNRLIFHTGGNKYRLMARASDAYKAVQIKFVGTHAEYDKIDAATVR